MIVPKPEKSKIIFPVFRKFTFFQLKTATFGGALKNKTVKHLFFNAKTFILEVPSLIPKGKISKF